MIARGNKGGRAKKKKKKLKRKKSTAPHLLGRKEIGSLRL